VTLPDVAHRFIRILLPLLAAASGVAMPLARRLVAAPLPGSKVFRDVDKLLHRHLAALQQRLTDPATSVRMVVTPERMVIDEAQRAHTDLALFEVGCDAVIMNRLLPEAAASEDFFQGWYRLQAERRHEVARLFAPLPVLAAPLGEDEVTGLEQLTAHGERIFADVEPDAVLSEAPRVRFMRDGADYLAIVPLPNADPHHLDVAKVDDELTITTGTRRRSLKLPRRFVPLYLTAARLDGSSMQIAFSRDPPVAEAR
jgi:arsenite-transporting ATPase